MMVVVMLNFIQENFTTIKNGQSTFKGMHLNSFPGCGSKVLVCVFCFHHTDTGYGEAIECVLIANIHKFGYLYHRYQVTD